MCDPTFPVEPNEYLDDQYPQFSVSNFQNTSVSSSSSSSSLSYHGFVNSAQDRIEFHPSEMPTYAQEDKHHAHKDGSHDLENRVHDKGLKFSIWRNQDQSEIKWMSSKMRLMQKMKSSSGKEISSDIDEDQKQQPADPSLETTDHQIFNSRNNASSYINNPLIRVCADCNTTKTPLWRSGPKGPKSLCNACGIRQRKARKAAAAAAANGKSVAPEPPVVKMKVQNKKLKKRSKFTAALAESSDAVAEKKNGRLEEFLFNLSKNLSFHRFFPQEEKDAAILLMALSCSRVHV